MLSPSRTTQCVPCGVGGAPSTTRRTPPHRSHRTRTVRFNAYALSTWLKLALNSFNASTACGTLPMLPQLPA